VAKFSNEDDARTVASFLDVRDDVLATLRGNLKLLDEELHNRKFSGVPDRIPCLNPNCRRTAAQDKYPGSFHIICGKCWRALPPRYRARWKQLKARWKKIERSMRKRATPGPVWNRIVGRIETSWIRLEADIVRYFTNTETPVGIEDFLKENGIV
jgi:hypothetical protein